MSILRRPLPIFALFLDVNESNEDRVYHMLARRMYLKKTWASLPNDPERSGMIYGDRRLLFII